ncbi:calcium-binding protein [Rhizorhabdus sp. FW153]|uniref:calcium-binding protein n=1 Tax=Rhizorhabdus sp. FW153 TaxID=3400216 RepID=UPI003CFBAE60
MPVAGVGNSPIRMDADFINLVREPEVLLRTSTELVLSTLNVIVGGGVGLGTFSFSGTGVQYNEVGEPIAGIITGVEIADAEGHVTRLSGLQASAAEFFDILTDISSGNVRVHPLVALLPGNDQIQGTMGDDIILDYSGHNILVGGPGRDLINSGSGNDHIYGHSPNGGGEDADDLAGGAGSDYIHGNAGNDDLRGDEGSDRLYGGQGRDRISAGTGNDTVNGNRDDDEIDGDDGNDLLRGGQGNDTIVGGNGDDILIGDRGVDVLDGDGLASTDGGSDTFVFGPETSLIGATMRDLDRILYFDSRSDQFSLGFIPEDIFFSGRNLVVTSPEDARAYAQNLFDSNLGDNEVAFVHYSSSTIMLWSSTGGGFVDSAVFIDNTFDPYNSSYLITSDNFL